MCVTPRTKRFAAMKNLAKEAASARSYSAVVAGYPAVKTGETIGAGYFPGNQCFVIISNATSFGNTSWHGPCAKAGITTARLQNKA